MRRLRPAVLGIWEFVVGDDPLAAAGVVVAIGLTALAVGAGITAWWVMPVGVLVILAASLRRAAGAGTPPRRPAPRPPDR